MLEHRASFVLTHSENAPNSIRLVEGFHFIYYSTTRASIMQLSSPCLWCANLRDKTPAAIYLVVTRTCVTEAALELLVLQLALQFLRLGHFPHRFVEIVLIDGIAIVLDGEQATVYVSECTHQIRQRQALRFGDNVPQVGTVEAVTHLDNALEVNFSLCLHAGSVDLHDFQAAHLIGQSDLDLPV